MFKFVSSRIGMLIPTALLLLLAAGCGGGESVLVAGVGSGGTGFISGAITKGPVGNASINAYAINGGQMGARIGSATSDVNGNFSMAIGSYAGAVMLQAGGGSYTDEATGAPMAMALGDVMTAVMPTVAAGANNTGIQVTPVTAMAQAMAQHTTGGMSETNIAAANLAMGKRFAVSDILHVAPMNPLVSGSGTGASQDAQNYGMTLAAMSKYAQTLGLSSSSTLVTAMMNDAGDGVLDGKAGGALVQMGGMSGGMMLPTNAGTSGMAEAMNTFMYSTQNKSGVITTDLVNQLNGDTGQTPGNPTARMSATVSGTVFFGAVRNATVMAFAVHGGTMGAQLAAVATDAQGNFTLPLGSYSGPLMLQVGVARYTDEASRTIMVMPAADVMSAVLPTAASGANVSGVWVTPITSMAQTRALAMGGGMTEANISAANTAMGNYFSVSDILHTQPMNPTLAGSGVGASQDARNYGMTLAAMAQYAKTLNMPVSSTLITAMMNDAADGVMNGKMGTNPVSMAMGAGMEQGMMASTSGTSGLAIAMTNFMNSSVNMSGLTIADMTALMQKLIASNGSI